MNYYAELPVISYQKTSVPMADVIAYLQSLDANKEVKRATYVIFRNESGNGDKGVNNNYIGFQADSGRWQAEYDKYLTGVCFKTENKTGKERIFLCFHKWQDSLDILLSKLEDRGLYIGGTTHKITHVFIGTKEGLAYSYLQEWVHGDKHYLPTRDQNGQYAEINSFMSMYDQAAKLFI